MELLPGYRLETHHGINWGRTMSDFDKGVIALAEELKRALYNGYTIDKQLIKEAVKEILTDP